MKSPDAKVLPSKRASMTLLLQSWVNKHGLGGKTDAKLKGMGRFAARRRDKFQAVTLAQQ
jgi:hypothetical protein